MKDTLRHKGLRNHLVEKLKTKGITSISVLKAINTVPRHFFMDSSFEDFAYQNKAFPIAEGQTISQPYTVAFQTELLDLKNGDKVLEVGTGSGYQTCILCELGASVYSVERQQKLYKSTKKFLDKLGYRPKYLCFGDGYKGIPEYAPFDKIIVTAGAPEVPTALLMQLKVGGRIVIPIGKTEQIMTLYKRVDKLKFDKHTFGEFKFVPLLQNKN